MNKITIINSDNNHRRFMGKLLQAFDIEVIFFQNTAIALSGLRYYGKEIRAIFIDQSIYESDTRELIMKVKFDPVLKSIPIILCSDALQVDKLQDLFDKGIGYLSKPIDKNTLKLNLNLIFTSPPNSSKRLA